MDRILAARGLRAFADGYVSLLLPLYLLDLGYSPLEIGVLTTATLLGSGMLTLLVGLLGHRHHYRSMLLAAALLMAATGAGFALFTQFWPLLLVAIVGTLNPSAGDVSVFLPLEHSLLSRSVTDRGRTGAFARYSLIGSLLGAAGSLVAGTPSLLPEWFGISHTGSLRFMFVLYAGLGLVTALLYRGLPRAASSEGRTPNAPLTRSKRHVYMLASLFSLDAFGGGFVVQSMVALWLYQRFGLSAASVGVIFFWTGVLSAVSFLVAVRIAKRIGLVNTMVFTHIPSSLCLIAIPFMPQIAHVIVLLFIRSALSQMDVPTRSSYVMAIVSPEERPAAAGITAVPRSIAAAASPSIAGYMLSLSAFGWPLIAAGLTKIVYDLLLLAMFRKVRPPEEDESSPRAASDAAKRPA